MDTTTIIGLIAGTLTTVSFVPQVVRTWKTRSTEDLSLAMFLIFTIGVACWLVYGILLRAWPIIVANSFTLALVSIVLYLKIRYNDE